MFFFCLPADQWVYSSGGTAMQDVVSAGDGMLPVPAKVSSFGTVYDEVSKERNAFNKTESIFWFKGQPDFALETFRIPPYMYCEDFRGRKDMPQFPDAFSTRVQKTVVQRDTLGNLATSEVTSFEQIYYYKDKALARRDFTPDPDLDVDIINKFLSKDPIRSVYDFNTGVMYLTSIPTGRCYYRPIIPGDFFDASKQHMYIKMADPAEIFRMEHDKMEYKGNDFSRDIECDVFAGKYFDEHYNATFIKETYISTNGWHEEADELLEYGVPVKHTILTEELSWQLVDNVTTYHFLKFKAKAPVLRIFDVSNCIETINHKDYAIMLTVSTSERSTIFKYKTQFLESAQWYLAEITAVFTPLRIQRLQLRQVSLASSDTSTLLAFTLVDKPRLKTQTPVGQPGSTFQEALSRLQHFIDRNQFALKFTAPQEIEPITVKALKGSLYVHTADGDLQAPEPIETEETDPEDEVTPSLLQADEEAEGSGRPMMSNGSLALLAFAMLFIGIGIGIAIMYLYLRRVNENKLEDRITLTPQTSTTEPDPLPTV
ncbi:uncharacterized protein CEXT_730571 [Caerostris extrusa]|uniref:LolA-like domain-containing protein n=1 Tax=Caerostris extrusa TaxID=172846 RepID=A0AAV4QRQ4_CAEEX|nr:uncharacterized protein CEXT_730571 [Caerostris extrusa]